MPDQKIRLQLVVDGCRDGNPLSQRKLYEYFYGYGMSICLRYAQDYQEAEEIFNDGFLKVFLRIHQYDTSQPIKPWIRRILVNTAIDHFRKRGKLQVIPMEHAHLNRAVTSQLPAIEPDDDVLPVLQQLSPAYRVVFNLYVMEEYKHHEIAEMLDISVGTSKSNLARAKQKLKALWIQKKSIAFKKTENG